MTRPQATIGVLTAVLVAATLGVLIYAMTRQARVSCEACVTFHGRTKCRTAAGPDREEATKTAVDNACGYLARGMADSISCSNTPPDRVRCGE
jgi:hypothetical protein